MKKLTILAFLSVGFFLISVNLFAQVETVEDPNAVATITPEEIIQLGQNTNAPSNGVIVLNFEGLGNSDDIMDFYDGGTSGQGFSGTDYGVEFSSSALSIIDEDVGGTGNFANEPSPSTIMFFLTGIPFMNVPAGFETGFSFYYAAYQYDGYVEIYDGLNGTGNLLGTAALPSTGAGVGDPNGGNYGNWSIVSVPFSGIAKSVKFGGVENQIGFDEVTFGSVTPGEPVPISNWAIVIVVLLIGTAIWFRRFR